VALRLEETALAGLSVAYTARRSDARGSFGRLFCDHELAVCFGARHVVQINHSRTTHVGAVRGMHYQRAPHAEMKLVRCLRGAVWDVAVDLRQGSATFLRWHAQELSAENDAMLIIPEGFAHGFQVLEEDSELLYLHTAHYAPDAEGGVSCLDPRLQISWPLPVRDLSARDERHPLLASDFTGLEWP
jgi:dTDP-4-dehydrorhamnose 3,5-epimerase